MSNDLTDPIRVQNRLAQLEVEQASRQNGWEKSAGDRARLTREWDKRLALYQRKTVGDNAETRKAKALVAAIEQDDLYERLTEAEAIYEAARIATKSTEVRVGIGQSILKAQGRA